MLRARPGAADLRMMPGSMPRLYDVHYDLLSHVTEAESIHVLLLFPRANGRGKGKTFVKKYMLCQVARDCVQIRYPTSMSLERAFDLKFSLIQVATLCILFFITLAISISPTYYNSTFL